LDFSGGFILVAPHEVLSQISVDTELSSQLSVPSTRLTTAAEALPGLPRQPVIGVGPTGAVTGLAQNTRLPGAASNVPVIGVGPRGVTGVAPPPPSSLPRSASPSASLYSSSPPTLP
jgi:hypothetical protein